VNSVQNLAHQASLEARFAMAARHSRLVRILRIAVPGAVGLAMAGVIGISIFNPFRMLMPKLPLDMDNLVVSGTKITMEAPHLSGYTPDQRPYEMWAKTAVQDVTDPDRVELHKLRTKLLMQDGSMVKNTVDSDEHVDVKLTNGTLSSDRLHITNGGEVVLFEGNVVMHLDHFDTDNGTTQAAAPAEPPPPAKKRSGNKSANSK